MIKIKFIKNFIIQENSNFDIENKEFKYMDINEAFYSIDSYIREKNSEITSLVNETHVLGLLNESVFDKVKEFFKKIKEFIKKMINKVIEFFEDKIKPILDWILEKLLIIGDGYIAIKAFENDHEFISNFNIKSFNTHPAFKMIKELKSKRGEERLQFINNINIEQFRQDIEKFNEKMGLAGTKDKSSILKAKNYSLLKLRNLIKQIADIKKELYTPLQEAIQLIENMEKEELQSYSNNETDEEKNDRGSLKINNLKTIIMDMLIIVRVSLYNILILMRKVKSDIRFMINVPDIDKEGVLDREDIDEDLKDLMKGRAPND